MSSPLINLFCPFLYLGVTRVLTLASFELIYEDASYTSAADKKGVHFLFLKNLLRTIEQFGGETRIREHKQIYDAVNALERASVKTKNSLLAPIGVLVDTVEGEYQYVTRLMKYLLNMPSSTLRTEEFCWLSGLRSSLDGRRQK